MILNVLEVLSNFMFEKSSLSGGSAFLANPELFLKDLVSGKSQPSKSNFFFLTCKSCIDHVLVLQLRIFIGVVVVLPNPF